MADLKREYLLCKKTATAHAHCQTLKEFDLVLNKADQADCKAKYNTVHYLKKITEW